MQGIVTVTAVMQDGTTITDRTADFATFTALVLVYRADPDCMHVRWEVADPPPPAAAQWRADLADDAEDATAA